MKPILFAFSFLAHIVPQTANADEALKKIIAVQQAQIAEQRTLIGKLSKQTASGIYKPQIFRTDNAVNVDAGGGTRRAGRVVGAAGYWDYGLKRHGDGPVAEHRPDYYSPADQADCVILD